MNCPTDLTSTAMTADTAQQVVAALESQVRELTHLLWRLERARHTLVPSPIDTWRGLTKLAFDSALAGIGVTMDDGITTLRSAIDSSRRALIGMNADG